MKKNFFVWFIPLSLCILIICSCATIVSKSNYPVTFSSNPGGAELSITDKKGVEIYKGSTPAVVSLKSGAGYFSGARYIVKLTMPGYKEKITVISHTLNGWYIGNLLFGGVIGMLIVDPLTGAMWRLDKSFVSETLYMDEASSTDPSLRVLSMKDIPQNWRPHLQKID